MGADIRWSPGFDAYRATGKRGEIRDTREPYVPHWSSPKTARRSAKRGSVSASGR